MKRILAAIQVAIVLAIIVFTTWQLFLGNFEVAMTGFPFLVAYYVFVVALKRRQ
jgi:hypothetical protein